MFSLDKSCSYRAKRLYSDNSKKRRATVSTLNTIQSPKQADKVIKIKAGICVLRLNKRLDVKMKLKNNASPKRIIISTACIQKVMCGRTSHSAKYIPAKE